MSNPEMYRILQRVQNTVQKQMHLYIIPEHLLISAAEEDRFDEIVNFCKSNKENILKIVNETIDSLEKANVYSDITATPEYTKTLKICTDYAESKKSEIRVEHVLLAILNLGPDSLANYALVSNKITLEMVEKFISQDKNKADFKYAENLTEKARNGEFDKIIGRKNELERIIQILHKKRSSNVILVSLPGVGKTALVQGLASKIAKNEVPDSLKNVNIWSLDLGSMIAGTRFRGEFEERLKMTINNVLKDGNVVLFIDEIHNIIGAGSGSDSSLDAGNILKPYLTDGRFRCIGATTYEEYKKHILKDRAFARRFKKIDLTEPSQQETIEILNGLRESYESFHGIKFPTEVLGKITELSDRYLTDQYFPDKAIEIMDEIGSKYRSGLKTGPEATVEDVEELICKIANIPNIEASKNDKDLLKNLSQNLKRELFGQDEIIEKIVNHIKVAKAGLTKKTKPICVFGMIGRSGTGKTELAKLLAKNLGISFLKLDMSEYSEKNSVSKLIGTSPGYVGFEQSGALTEPLIRNPNCVVLFDEIEKADKSIYDLLLQVMDEGRLTDNNNRIASFRNAIILMSSNVGCAKAEKVGNFIGFLENESKKESVLDSALKSTFSPEFRNRFTEIFKFNDLDRNVIAMIVDKEIKNLNDSLKEKKIEVILNDEAKDFIVEKAMQEDMGGRPVERLIQRHVAEKIVDAILFANLSDTFITFKKGNDDLKIENESSMSLS